MSAVIQIKLNPTDVANVKKMLWAVEEKVPVVLSRSINKTLDGVKTDASTEIRAVITAKKSMVDKTFKTMKSTPKFLSARFESRGRPLPLIEYSARQTAKGVSVQVKRQEARKVIAGTFIATMKSGHKGVFWREWHAAERKPKDKRMAYSKLPKRYRLPIEQRFGPRVPDILENMPVMNAVLSKADDRLHKNIEHELSFEVSKL